MKMVLDGKTMEFLVDNWIKQGLVILLGALTILHLDYTEACSCEFTHPQQQLCNADFVIKATVKRTDAIFEEGQNISNEIIQEPFRNETYVVEPVNVGPIITARVFYVKVKKVFKYTEQYGEVEARYKDQDIDLMPVYTASDQGTCGVNLMDKTTYLLQGHVRDNELHIDMCRDQQEWTQENIPVYMRKAYGRLYEENCQCNIFITWKERNRETAPNECVWDKRKDTDSCYAKHAVCMKNDSSDHCKWSRPSSLRACLARTEQRRMQEP